MTQKMCHIPKNDTKAIKAIVGPTAVPECGKNGGVILQALVWAVYSVGARREDERAFHCIDWPHQPWCGVEGGCL